MDFALTANQEQVRDAVAKICARFDDAYWLKKDKEGGFGYAKEYHVERYLRESLIPRIAPISPQLIFSFIAEKVLGLPKSY
jgi:hypothetical protein